MSRNSGKLPDHEYISYGIEEAEVEQSLDDRNGKQTVTASLAFES